MQAEFYQNINYGFGASGRTATPILGFGASGRTATPILEFEAFAVDWGKDPAYDSAKFVAAIAMIVITSERNRFAVRDMGKLLFEMMEKVSDDLP